MRHGQQFIDETNGIADRAQPISTSAEVTSAGTLSHTGLSTLPLESLTVITRLCSTLRSSSRSNDSRYSKTSRRMLGSFVSSTARGRQSIGVVGREEGRASTSRTSVMYWNTVTHCITICFRPTVTATASAGAA